MLSVAVLIDGKVQAQEKSKDPYELMSKYYEDSFNPYAKGNWYVGFAFSLKDQNLQNQARLFDKVLEGNDLPTRVKLIFKSFSFWNQ